MTAIDPRIEAILGNVEAYQATARELHNVPAWQALPPASAPDVAYRPRCSQLEPIWQADTTDWVWSGTNIHTTPGQSTMTPQVALEHQAAGICLTGSHAVDVPLVATDDVFSDFVRRVDGPRAIAASPPEAQQEIPQAIATPAPEPGGGVPFLPAVLVAAGILGVFFYSRHLHGQKSVNAPVHETFTDLPQYAPTAEQPEVNDPGEIEYDFEL
jgi:hypothetical protein